MSAHRLYIGTTSVLPASAHMVPQVYILAVDLRSYVRTYQPYHITYTYCIYIPPGNNCAEHIRSVASCQTRICCILKHVMSCVCRYCAKNRSADLSVDLAHRHRLHACQPKRLCHITEDTDSFLLQVILDLQIKGPSAHRSIQIWHQSNDQ